MNISRLKKNIENGLDLTGKTGSVRLVNGVYHSLHCSRIRWSAPGPEIILAWGDVLKNPAAFCKCYSMMLFAGVSVEKWYRHYEALVKLEEFLLRPLPGNLKELSVFYHDVYALSRKLEDSPVSNERTLAAIDAVKNLGSKVARSHTSTLEKDLIKESLEACSRKMLPFLNPEFDSDASLADAFNMKLKNLTESPERVIFQSLTIPLSGAAARNAFIGLYQLADELYIAPTIVFQMLVLSSARIKQKILVEETPNLEVLEALSVLFDPKSSGPYSQLDLALEAAQNL